MKFYTYSFNIVNELLGTYQYKLHIVYTDNYYTSLKLARYLLSTGSTRKSSRGVPHIDTVRIDQGDTFKLANEEGIVVR